MTAEFGVDRKCVNFIYVEHGGSRICWNFCIQNTVEMEQVGNSLYVDHCGNRKGGKFSV